MKPRFRRRSFEHSYTLVTAWRLGGFTV